MDLTNRPFARITHRINKKIPARISDRNIHLKYQDIKFLPDKRLVEEKVTEYKCSSP